MPEMVTAVQAARRGQHDLIVGNVLESNIFNSLAAGGLIALVAPRALSDPDLTGLAAIAMVAAALLTTLFLVTDRRLSRWEAALLLGTYAGLLPLLSR
jgi:cation:H+ antiporter